MIKEVVREYFRPLKLFNTFFPKPPSDKCQHTDVKVQLVECVTNVPTDGYCLQCGKSVKARLIWEEKL
jgi:hypothetical protein